MVILKLYFATRKRDLKEDKVFDWVKDDLKNFGSYASSDSDIKKLSEVDTDIVFIGSGIASTFTLIEFVNQLEEGYKKNSKNAINNPINILVFEKDSWLWGGIPYGRRSGFTSLIITPLDEFLPENELSLFIKWMSENIDWLIVPFKENAGPRSKKWLGNSEKKIRSGDSSKIHIPRYFFGIYVWEKLKLAISNSSININLDFVKAEVDSVTKNNGPGIKNFKLMVDAKHTFFTSQILLGVGIPQIRSLDDNKKLSGLVYFENPYYPDLVSTIKKIEDQIRKEVTSNILIIGANASALELIYQITNLNNLKNIDIRFSVLSPQGKLPDYFIKDKVTNFVASKLQELSDTSGDLTADAILDAFKEDLYFADNNNFDISDTLPIFTNHVGNLIKRLPKYEKYEFTKFHGIEIGRLQRRAGYEYTLPIKELLAINKINIIKGKFKSFSNNEGVTKVEFYKESQNSPQSDYFDIVINCAGSAGLIDNGMSPLLRQLNESGLCKPTPSNHGLVVGNKFNAAPGFFINGPLLAGNVVGEMGIWHVEHTGRIIGFAKQIANNMIIEAGFKPDFSLKEDA